MESTRPFSDDNDTGNVMMPAGANDEVFIDDAATHAASSSPSPEAEGFVPFHVFSREAKRAVSGTADDKSGNIDHALASPLLASAWAQAIARYWEAGLSTGRIVRTEPLYLFDPAPGGGHVLWLLLRALEVQAGRLGLDFRYLVCGGDASSPASFDALAHPYLRRWFDSGRLDIASWEGAALRLERHGIRLDATTNPAVILARGWFGSFPSHLYGIHYGKIMEGEINPAQQEFQYRWRDCEAEALPPTLRRLLEHGLQRLASVTLPLPLAAWDALSALSRLAGERYLLISADHGCWSEQQLRLGALTLPQEPGEGALPGVNHHALTLFQQQHGARVWNRQHDEQSFVLHAAWRDDSAVPAGDDDAWQQLCDILDSQHPDDAAHLPQLHEATLPASLALLRRYGHDPRLLACHLPTLLQEVASLGDSAGAAWRTALRLIWENHFPAEPQDSFGYQLGVLAIHLADWPLARDGFHLAAQMGNADALHGLAFVESATGNHDSAQELVQQVLQQMPEHPSALALQDELQGRRQRWQALAWYAPHIADGELCLEPLGQEHAGSMLYQYRDPQIGPMARLPEMTTPEQVEAWIEEQNAAGACYAVMHRVHGFVGMTGMRYAENAGYFYFWIGTDFQTRGFGRRAAQLTFRQLQAHGVKEFFTSVYPDNVRSNKALAALGFRTLPVRSAAPDDDQVFLWQAPPGDACAVAAGERLIRLCGAIGGPDIVPLHTSV